MLDSVAETIVRYSMFAPGNRVGVAVSGGADSICLLQVLHTLAPRWNLKLEVLHFNHRWRGEESDADAAFVRSQAADFGLPFHLGEAVTDMPRGSREEAARRERLEFFFSHIRVRQLDRVATAHTRSDQAETVLFRILRGTGTAGLAGIRPVTAQGLVRPLIEISRDRVRAWLSDRGIRWREDSSNADLSLTRNRIRLALLPELAARWNPRIEDALARFAEVAAGEEDYWDRETEQAARELVDRRGSAVEVSARSLAALDPALARRLIRRVASDLRGDPRGLEFQHIEKILRLATGERGAGRVRLHGIEAVRSLDRIRIVSARGTRSGYAIEINPPARAALAEGVVSVEILKNPEGCMASGYTNNGNDLDWSLLKDKGRLEVRSWQPGDRYQPLAASRPHKLKILFQRARVPSWDRVGWPMITIGEAILWSRRFGVARAFAATETSSDILRIHEVADGSIPAPETSV